LAAGFFAGAFLAGTGMAMPGMCICAIAGAGTLASANALTAIYKLAFTGILQGETSSLNDASPAWLLQLLVNVLAVFRAIGGMFAVHVLATVLAVSLPLLAAVHFLVLHGLALLLVSMTISCWRRRCGCDKSRSYQCHHDYSPEVRMSEIGAQENLGGGVAISGRMPCSASVIAGMAS
jgi:hypothetical protein